MKSRSATHNAGILPLGGRFLAYARAVRRLLVVFVLACFVAQGTAVQSHLHWVEHSAATAAGQGHGYVDSAPSRKGESPADCPLCQAAAVAGAFVLPAIPALPPPPPAALWHATPTLASFALLPPSLGWLSRAPPE